MSILTNLPRAARRFLLGTLACACLAHAGASPFTFFRSAKIDDVRTMQSLLAEGADPNQTEPERGESAMIVALREDAPRVFMLLLAQPTIRLEATAHNGNTALMMACYKGNQAAVLALLDKGAEINSPGWSPLHYAAAAGADAIVRILLEHHAAIDAEAPRKITPLMIAAREGQYKTVNLLLAAGADAGLKNGDGMTAAALAEQADKPSIAAAIRAHLQAKAGR